MRRYPGRRDEGWWLVVCSTSANQLLTIKKVSLSKVSVKSTLSFDAPRPAGPAQADAVLQLRLLHGV